MTTTEAITQIQAIIIADAKRSNDYSLEQELKDSETITNLTILKIIARNLGMD